MLNYIGITIGPIYDTIMEASSPASLWFASSMFSDITKRMIKEITGSRGFENVRIYSPYYDAMLDTNDGVGKYHDRIIFSTTNFSDGKLKQIINKVKEDTAEVFEQRDELTRKFLTSYLQIHFIALSDTEIQESNCILSLTPYLDTLELMKTFPHNDVVNPIRRVFAGEKDNSNRYIKNSGLFQGIDKENNQFMKKDGSIYSIGDIVTHHGKIPYNTSKKYYFAVVSADGDGMGTFLGGLSSDEVTDFSKSCLHYNCGAAKLIGEYGGMTIYAGGDDLLFLAPVINEDGATIFKLCNRIQQLFQDEVGKAENTYSKVSLPTLSFGISIQHDKYPLYEAFDNSRALLALAKHDGDFTKEDCTRDNMVIEVQRSSGPIETVLVGNKSYQAFEQLLSLCKDDRNDTSSSMLRILETFEPLFFLLNKEARLGNISYQAYEVAWLNHFDGVGQTQKQDYIKEICRSYYDKLVIGKERIYMPVHRLQKTNIDNLDLSLLALFGMLRIEKFLKEVEGE